MAASSALREMLGILLMVECSFRTGGVAGLYGAVEVRAITVHFRLYLCEGQGSQVLDPGGDRAKS